MYPTTTGHPDEVVMSPPAGKHDAISSLRVLQIEDPDMGIVQLSAWLPTPEDLEKINSGAPIYLQILSPHHPPVALTVGDP